ncbi:hypothetical protein TraAM80_08252 [Trypanosoma rangeli]|uniref:Uncharacterized protein n=1 Tax=Trypanosoma rangeli TaxID=5698 RepID=A0A3R7KFA4_TRYRA|nr:uncharacterized protein TraAM80_08252 [Trypanosoma rangeli]RNE99341.1 hypothetical protein TraAM80_08252 [Trypanosoma rangeli]|eukprot:RNE99341.1 hypothetical protein TraAM80_08252 [Trypanosoma rangeli]
MWSKKGAVDLCCPFLKQVHRLTSSSSFFRFPESHQRRHRLVTTAPRETVTASLGCSSSTTTSNNNLACSWVWNETENWCSLCLEPHNGWNEHRGKRDHICLEMFYNALVQYNRQWTPATLWWEVEKCTLLRRSSSDASRLCLDITHELLGESYLDYVHAPTAGKDNLSALMKYYDRAEHYERRLELYACIQHLIENGIVRTDRTALSGGSSFHGSLVAFKELFPNLVNMFPYADAKEISALTQMIASTYNSETVFDLCNFRALFPWEQGQEVTEAKNHISPSTEEIRGDAIIPDSAVGEYSYHWKGVFCRGVMGQLRWALESDSVACPLQTGKGKRGGVFSDQYWHVLAEHTCRALLAEMVFCRVSEYVVRVEGVWRRRGQKVVQSPTIAGRSNGDDALLKLTSNWGMLKYMDDHFYESSFGNHLPNDGMPKGRRGQVKA